MELTWAEHVTLGGAVATDDRFGGYVVTLGGLYIPEKYAQDADGNHFIALTDYHAGLAKLLGGVCKVRVYKDSTDDEDECSLHAGKVGYLDQLAEYAGEINVGPLTRSVDNYVYVNMQTLAAGIATGAWPTGGHILRVGIIAMPATGHWLPDDLEPVLGAQAITISGLGVAVVSTTITHASSAETTLYAALAGQKVGARKVAVLSAFNNDATLSIGKENGDPEDLVAATDVNLAVEQVYSVEACEKLADDDDIIVTLTGNPTAGEAYVMMELWP